MMKQTLGKKEKDEDHAPVACLPNLTVTASCQSPSYPYPSRLRSSRQYLGLTALNTAPTLYCHFLPSEKYGRNTMRGKSFRFGGGSNLFFPFFVVARRQLTRNTQTLERGKKKGNGPYFCTILIFPIISNPLLCQLFEKRNFLAGSHRFGRLVSSLFSLLNLNVEEKINTLYTWYSGTRTIWSTVSNVPWDLYLNNATSAAPICWRPIVSGPPVDLQ